MLWQVQNFFSFFLKKLKSDPTCPKRLNKMVEIVQFPIWDIIFSLLFSTMQKKNTFQQTFMKFASTKYFWKLWQRISTSANDMDKWGERPGITFFWTYPDMFSRTLTARGGIGASLDVEGGNTCCRDRSNRGGGHLVRLTKRRNYSTCQSFTSCSLVLC